MLSELLDEYSRALRRLHRLIDACKGDTEPADNLRNRMDGIWNRMDSGERNMARILSASLSSEYGDPLPLDPGVIEDSYYCSDDDLGDFAI